MSAQWSVEGGGGVGGGGFVIRVRDFKYRIRVLTFHLLCDGFCKLQPVLQGRKKEYYIFKEIKRK